MAAIFNNQAEQPLAELLFLKTRAAQPANFHLSLQYFPVLLRIRGANHTHRMFDTHIIRRASSFDSESAAAPSLGWTCLDEGRVGRQCCNAIATFACPVGEWRTRKVFGFRAFREGNGLFGALHMIPPSVFWIRCHSRFATKNKTRQRQCFYAIAWDGVLQPRRDRRQCFCAIVWELASWALHYTRFFRVFEILGVVGRREVAWLYARYIAIYNYAKLFLALHLSL